MRLAARKRPAHTAFLGRRDSEARCQGQGAKRAGDVRSIGVVGDGLGSTEGRDCVAGGSRCRWVSVDVADEVGGTVCAGKRRRGWRAGARSVPLRQQS